MEKDDEIEKGAGIQVIARAAKILRDLKDEPHGLTLTQLAVKAGLPRSTVQRIVSALLQERLLVPASLWRGVRLGPEIIALAGEVQPGVIELARPYLEELRDLVKETVDLAKFCGNHILFIDQHLSGRRLCAMSGVGRTFPLHNSANGKACLALLSEPEARRAAIVSSDDPDPAKLEPLMKEIQEIERTNLAYDWEENAPGICAVGTAFRFKTGQIYAIAVPTPADRFQTSHVEIGQHLLAMRRKLLAALAKNSKELKLNAA